MFTKTLLAISACLLAAPAATALPNQDVLQEIIALYPNSLSASNAFCHMCHLNPQGTQPWNGYGWGIRQGIDGGLSISQAIVAMETLDSDSDPGGATNLEELMADAQPGWTVGPNNTVYFINGTTDTGESPPNTISGDIDPPAGFGNAYCGTTPNSAGAGAILAADGSDSVAADDVTLNVTGGISGQFGLIYYGPNQISVPFGDGTRCVGGSTSRLGPPQAADGFGQYSRSVRPLTEGFVGGQSVNFQYWYRDPGGPGGTGFNLSQGLEIIFTP